MVSESLSFQVGGPLWLLQLWLYANFPEIRPNSGTIDSRLQLCCFGESFCFGDFPSNSFPETFQFFYQVSLIRHTSLFFLFRALYIALSGFEG